MRWTLTISTLALYLLLPRTGHAEWKEFDATKSFGVWDDTPYAYVAPPTTAGAYSCPEGTRYTSVFNAEKMRYDDKCETENYDKIQDADADGVDDSYQTSFLTSIAASTNPLSSSWLATHVGVSQDNPFLMNAGAIDKALTEYQSSDNPFIKMVREQGPTLDGSMVEQVRNNLDLQDKIRQKLGNGYVGQFDRFMNR